MSKTLQVEHWSDDEGEYFDWATSYDGPPTSISENGESLMWTGQTKDPQDLIELAHFHHCDTITITLESE